MAVINKFPLPLQDPIARPKDTKEYGPSQSDPKEGTLTDAWADALNAVQELVERSPTRISSVALTGQSASIPATDLTDGTLTEGLYEVKHYLQVTTKDSTSLEIMVTLDWQTNAFAQSEVFANLTGNTEQDHQSDGVPLIRVDAGSPVRYSTTVVSGTGDGRYSLDVELLEIHA